MWSLKSGFGQHLTAKFLLSNDFGIRPSPARLTRDTNQIVMSFIVTECVMNSFLCHKHNTCIMINQRCDGEKECDSGEDEEDCEGKCQQNDRVCKKKVCMILFGVFISICWRFYVQLLLKSRALNEAIRKKMKFVEHFEGKLL